VLSLLREITRSAEFRGRFFEFLVSSRKSEVNDRVYEGIVPTATYTPWRSDTEFLNIFDRVVGHTLVDLYRCWNLWQLVRQVAKSPAGADHFVEIGVWRGGTGVLIAKAMATQGLRQPLYLCDIFRGVVKTGEADPHYHGGEHSDASAEDVAALASSLGLTPDSHEIVSGVFPEEMPATLQEGNFSFAHLDVDAYQSAKDCFSTICLRMTPGGIVVFDDYGFVTTSGIARLVDELMGVPDGVCMYNLTGQAVFVKL
jgi:O-methyltransferase